MEPWAFVLYIRTRPHWCHLGINIKLYMKWFHVGPFPYGRLYKVIIMLIVKRFYRNKIWKHVYIIPKRCCQSTDNILLNQTIGTQTSVHDLWYDLGYNRENRRSSNSSNYLVHSNYALIRVKQKDARILRTSVFAVGPLQPLSNGTC